MEKLFVDFSKLNEHDKMNPTGTGLGLSICRKIIEEGMGGSVKASSVYGEGTTFIIDMRAKIKLQDERARLEEEKI